MKIISAELSAEVKGLVKEIFGGNGFPAFFKHHTEDYLWHILKHLAEKRKADVSGEFREEMRLLAIRANNAISYGISLNLGNVIDDD